MDFKRILPIKIIIVLLLLFLSSCVGAEQKPEESLSGEIKGGKEIFLSRDPIYSRPSMNIDRWSSIPSFWCGPGSDLIYYKDGKILRHEIDSGEKREIYLNGGWPMSCTSDGKWLTFLGDYGEPQKGPDKRKTIEIWRYNFKTEKREQIGVGDWVIDGRYETGLVSPDGKKLFISVKLDERAEVEKSAFEVVESEVWYLGSAHWFPDSSAVIADTWDMYSQRSDLVLEMVRPKRKTIQFKPKFGVHGLAMIDALNRIYLEVAQDGWLERCKIDLEQEEIECSVILDREKDINDFDIFSDMETFAFVEQGGRCVKSMRVGEKAASCITPSELEIGPFVDISPDERWIVFFVFHRLDNGKVKGQDLYISKITKNKENNHE